MAADTGNILNNIHQLASRQLLAHLRICTCNSNAFQTLIGHPRPRDVHCIIGAKRCDHSHLMLVLQQADV